MGASRSGDSLALSGNAGISLGTLVGATVLEADLRTFYGVTYPRLRVRLRGGRVVDLFVSQDDEGNDGGVIQAEEPLDGNGGPA